MSDTTFSDIDFNYEMAWVWTTLKIIKNPREPWDWFSLKFIDIHWCLLLFIDIRRL